MPESSLLDKLGLDERDVTWPMLAACKGTERDWFFDYYETDPELARATDEMCLSCPVFKTCLKEGVMNKEWGVWGGVYLNNGKADPARNLHKTEEVWRRWNEKVRSDIDDTNG